jgi:hypothetical protein
VNDLFRGASVDDIALTAIQASQTDAAAALQVAEQPRHYPIGLRGLGHPADNHHWPEWMLVNSSGSVERTDSNASEIVSNWHSIPSMG